MLRFRLSILLLTKRAQHLDLIASKAENPISHKYDNTIEYKFEKLVLGVLRQDDKIVPKNGFFFSKIRKTFWKISFLTKTFDVREQNYLKILKKSLVLFAPKWKNELKNRCFVFFQEQVFFETFSTCLLLFGIKSHLQKRLMSRNKVTWKFLKKLLRRFSPK